MIRLWVMGLDRGTRSWGMTTHLRQVVTVIKCPLVSSTYHGVRFTVVIL